MSRYMISAVLVLLFGVRFSTSQDYTLDFNKLRGTIDTNADQNISRGELEQFFKTFQGNGTVTRCQFQEIMVKDFSATPKMLSAYFDLMQQSGNGRILTSEEFIQSIMGSATDLPAETMRTNLDQMNQRIRIALEKPYQSNVGPNTFQPNDFKAALLAQDADSNKDGLLTRDEISWLMWSLDTNKDFGIQRCEFVDEMMTRFKQHPVTSDRMFDLLFKSGEITWADIDSDFLLRSVSEDGGPTISTTMFKDYMSLKNSVAAGIVGNTKDEILMRRNHGLTLTSGIVCLVLTMAFTVLHSTNGVL